MDNNILITPIFNSISFCGKKQIKSIFSPAEQKMIAEYKQNFVSQKIKPMDAKIKRAIDLTLSFIGLVVTSPVILLSSMAIKFDSLGPVLYKQARIGKDGKLFTIYKLRTLERDSGHKILQNANDRRVTYVGKFLRKYSIDEFPQFINIIKGDMSLVGPRPITKNVHDLRKNDKDFFLRYSVKPGATLNYNNPKRNDLPNIRINTEKDYIENWSLANDLKILKATMSKIFKGENY